MRTILAILLCLPMCIVAQVPPPAPASVQDVIDGTATYKFVSPASLSGAGITGGGGGGVVSNVTGLSFTLNTRITNNTEYGAIYSQAFRLYNPGGAASSVLGVLVTTDTGFGYHTNYLQGLVPNSADTNVITASGYVRAGGVILFTNYSSTGFILEEGPTGSILYLGSGSGGSGDVTQAGLAAGSYSVAWTYTNAISYSTNTSYNKTNIYVSGNASSAVNGTYRRHWYNPDTMQGVWTNTASTNIIWQNSGHDTIWGFYVTDGTNSGNRLYSFDSISTYQDRINFILSPLGEAEGTFTGTATIAWGTNIDSTVSLATFDVHTNSVTDVIRNTNVLRVEIYGDDNLASRTNGFPFKTLWAANNAAGTGDRIEIGAGRHTTYGLHMKRSTHIVGAGKATVLEILPNDDVSLPQFFGSPLISVWDDCSIGNMVISNGAIGFTQHEGFGTQGGADGSGYGGTNQFAYDLWIYPAKIATNFSPVLQPSYFSAGVKVSRIGQNITLERVRVFTGFLGFSIQSAVSTNTGSINLIDCEVISSPEYSGGDTTPWRWHSQLWPGVTNVGGAIPIAFTLGETSQSFNRSGVTLNIVGGRYTSFLGYTNQASYVGGETNTKRNAGIWIARGHTNQIVVNFSGNPQFILGGTNGVVPLVLNEATNNNVNFTGIAQVRQVTNSLTQPGLNTLTGNGSGLTNLLSYQTVYASGSAATSSGSTATMNFGTTDPVLTVSETGVYQISASAIGITSSADSGLSCAFYVYSNTVALADSVIAYPAQDAGLTGTVFPWAVTLPKVYSVLNAGDSVSLRWNAVGTDYQAQYADLSILRVK